MDGILWQALISLTLIDLFAGIGGVRQAFEKTGLFRTILSSEIDAFARQTYKANFGEEPLGDIREIVFKALQFVDVIFAGLPCQAFSLIGKRLGFEDVRGTLFYEFLRALREVMPKAFVIENVEGLVSHDRGRTLKTMLRLLRRVGYKVAWKVLDARDFGVPQKRRRIFIVGIRKDINATFQFPKGNGKTARFGDILEPVVDSKYLLSAEYRRGLEARTARNVGKGNGFGMAIPDLDGAANTITVGGSGRERNLVRVGKDHLRRLTPREFARLQGFPDSFRIPVSDTQAYKQFGNSVPVPVVEAIAGNLARALISASSQPAVEVKAPVSINSARKNTYATGDFFCGMGGFASAADATGRFNVVFSSEINSAAAEVYRRNFGAMPSGDITKIDAKDIPDAEVFIGGFPCQPFSVSGNQKGFDDERGQLFHHVARIAKHHRPKAMLLENVKNFVSHDGGNTARVVRKILEGLGYRVKMKVLNASGFGVPQARERVFIVAIRKDIPDVFEFPEPRWNGGCVRDILLPDSETEHLVIRRDDIVLRPESTFPTSPVDRPVQIGSLGKGGQGYRIYHPLGQGITLSAEGGGVGARTGLYLVNGKVRRLAPRECARLQGFPDTFVLPENPVAAYRQLGNAVAVPLVAAIAQNLATALDSAVAMPLAA